MSRRFRLAFLAALSLSLVAAIGPGRIAPVASQAAPTQKVVFFASDGMRPDLMEKYAAAGAMPTYRSLMASGVRGANGMVQAFPPNTGVGWYTMATGTYPSEHGSTNNTFHRTGDAFGSSTSFAATGILQADTIQQAAERAGKVVASVEWVGSRNLVPALQGPVVDFRSFFSNRGVLVNYDIPGQPARIDAFINPGPAPGFPTRGYQRVDLDAAAGWTNVPASFSPAMQESLKVANTAGANNVDRFYDLYIYDSTNDSSTNYDHVLMVPSTVSKDGSASVANLTQGDWQDVKVTLTGPRVGQTAGFYVKAIDIADDLSQFRLYYTSVTRVNATYNALGAAGSAAFEETLAHDFPTSTAADFAPLEGGIVDEDTYAEQGLMWKDAHWAYLHYILEDLGVRPDLLMLGVPTTDEFSHQFMGLVTPTDMDGDPNPYFDDVEGDGIPDGRVAAREGYIREAYQEADSTLALGRSLMGGDPTTLAGSDHGFGAQWYAVNARKVLFDQTLGGSSIHGSGGNTASNCGAVASDLTKACWAGGTAQVYINPALTFDPMLRPTAPTYAQVQNAVIDAFQNLSDPANPGKQVVLKIMKKDELRNVDGSDSLHPNRSGDVVVVLRPPYQFDAATPGQPIAFSQFFGQHGYLPDLVDIAHNVNMHATFVAGGPGIRHQSDVAGVRAVDLAPSISYFMGIPEPQNARGKIMLKLFTGASALKEVDILDISDYHGQLIPLAEASDTVGPTFGIGGAAFLKPWFDVYRAENPGATITVAAGDSVGATPPISAFFGDKPTIELMNHMGFTYDGLGNHNFDRGQQYLRNELIPLAKFKFVSANIVDPATGKTPAEWAPSRTFDFGAVSLAVIGFSNDDLPTLINPAGLVPFVVTNSTAAVNKRADQLSKQQGIDAVVAIGHLGATGGTLTEPIGPAVDLADNVTNVDAVIGDHTDFQVLSHRPNGVLLTENRSKGVRFTRVRLIVDTVANQVVYKTADFHKPWDIGVTPDPTIQGRIDELNAELAPILNTQLGSSSKFIPRTDQCGNGNGRTCESLVGNVVTDAMRTKYASIGVEFAITNSGGLRADLTCPTTDNPNDFCPAYTPPPFPITRGQVLTVLPFGNVVATLTVNGAELKTMLENGVSRMPAVDGRFPQVSGLCFTYDIAAPAGSRVTSAVRADAAGNCTATPVALTSSSMYEIAENDFMMNGGDGYPVFSSRATTQDIMDQVTADYIGANTPLSPFVKAFPDGRINCADTNGPGVGNDCPTLTPSFP